MSVKTQSRRELALFALATAAGAGVNNAVCGIELDGFDTPGVNVIVRMGGGKQAIERIAEAYKTPIETRRFSVSGENWRRHSTIVNGAEFFAMED